MKRLIPLMLSLTTLAATAKEAPRFDPAAEPASLAATFLDGEKLKNLARVRRVAIVNFRVEFAVENDAKASSSGTTGWTSAKSDIKLAGVDDTTRQAIVDQLHDRFVTDLRAAGVEVVPYDTLKANADYQSMASRFLPGQEPKGTQSGKSIFLGPHGQPVYFTNDDHHLGLGTALSGFSTVQTQNIEPAIAKSLDAAVVRATFAVAFAEQQTSGGMFSAASSVKSKAQLAFVPNLTQVLVITPTDGKARVSLEKAAHIEGDVLDLKDTTSSGEKATQAVANVVTGLLAGGGRTERHYEATSAPGAYADAIGRYGTALVSAMTGLMKGSLPAAPAPAPAAAEPAAAPASP